MSSIHVQGVHTSSCNAAAAYMTHLLLGLDYGGPEMLSFCAHVQERPSRNAPQACIRFMRRQPPAEVLPLCAYISIMEIPCTAPSSSTKHSPNNKHYTFKLRELHVPATHRANTGAAKTSLGRSNFWLADTVKNIAKETWTYPSRPARADRISTSHSIPSSCCQRSSDA